jgi:hypothetical protein
MKTKLFASFALSIALLGAPSGISISCVDGDASGGGDCAPGRVTFTGTQYPENVHVKVVRNSDGVVYDNWDYNTNDEGRLRFTETLVPAGDYTMTVSASGSDNVITVTTN